MAWIKSHDTLAHHPKTLRLARRLGTTVPAAIGHLHLLWWWAMDYAEDGNLTGFDSEEIALACMWESEPGTFISALTVACFIDDREDGPHIHDWLDAGHAGARVESRKRNTERMRDARAAHVQRTPSARATHDENCAGLEKSRVEKIPPISPNDEKPAGKITQIDSLRAKELTEGFEDFYRAYPRKVGKSAASKSWFTLKPNTEMRATILAALEQHKASRDWQKDGGQFVPHPATWLNGKRWLDELENAPTNPNRVFGGDGRLAL